MYYNVPRHPQRQSIVCIYIFTTSIDFQGSFSKNKIMIFSNVFNWRLIIIWKFWKLLDVKIYLSCNYINTFWINILWLFLEYLLYFFMMSRMTIVSIGVVLLALYQLIVTSVRPCFFYFTSRICISFYTYPHSYRYAMGMFWVPLHVTDWASYPTIYLVCHVTSWENSNSIHSRQTVCSAARVKSRNNKSIKR